MSGDCIMSKTWNLSQWWIGGLGRCVGALDWIGIPTTGPQTTNEPLVENPGWWQLKYFFFFNPKFGEDEPILTVAYFFRWVDSTIN